MAGTKITISTKKSVEQNAQVYFEKAKKQRSKLEGARKALTISLKKLENITTKGEENLKVVKDQQQERIEKSNKKKEWYENFRWFYTSEGFFVIGGRDATTNEIVIKKHTDKEDVVFHTDMSGSPFFVIKCKEKMDKEKKGPGEASIQETTDATLVFSRAWKLGLITTPVFWVTPQQVSKEPNPGEFLPKGAFMIRGKTNYMHPTPNCAIGPLKESINKDRKLMCAPLAAVKANCDKYVELKQGNDKPSQIAKKIKARFGGDLDDIIRILPSGNLDIKK